MREINPTIIFIEGVLRNLTQENNSHRLYVAAQSGLELLIKVRSS